MACISTFQGCSTIRGAKINTRNRNKGGAGKGSPTFQCKASTSLRLELDENPEAIISGEWPENFSLLSYDDLRAYLESQQQAVQVGNQNVALLCEAMSAPVLVATAEQTLEEVECHFEAVSGLPVVDSSLRCVGVVVKSDQAKASHGRAACMNIKSSNTRENIVCSVRLYLEFWPADELKKATQTQLEACLFGVARLAAADKTKSNITGLHYWAPTSSICTLTACPGGRSLVAMTYVPG